MWIFNPRRPLLVQFFDFLKKMLLLLAIIFFCCYVSSLAFTCAKYHRYPTCIYDNNIEKSLENARKNIIERKSPGAGLATAGVCLLTHSPTHSLTHLLYFHTILTQFLSQMNKQMPRMQI